MKARNDQDLRKMPKLLTHFLFTLKKKETGKFSAEEFCSSFKSGETRMDSVPIILECITNKSELSYLSTAQCWLVGTGTCFMGRPNNPMEKCFEGKNHLPKFNHNQSNYMNRMSCFRKSNNHQNSYWGGKIIIIEVEWKEVGLIDLKYCTCVLIHQFCV